MKYTPFMLRLLTENLLEITGAGAGTAGEQIAMLYSVTPTPRQAVTEEIAYDTPRMRYAIETGDYDHLLEMEFVTGSAGEDDGKGLLWSVDAPSSQVRFRPILAPVCGQMLWD